MFQIIAIFAAFLIGICSTLLVLQIHDLRERVEKLEEANRQRMPHRAQDEILDAMATLDALEHEAQFRNDLIQNAKAHLINSMAVGTKREGK